MLYERILDRITSIENNLSQELKRIDDKLSQGQDYFTIINHGLNGYRKNVEKELSQTNAVRQTRKILLQISEDNEIRHPHKKIIEFLLKQYDHEKQQYKEIPFNKLVRNCHVGKNMANNYLSLLIRKGYIERRSDNYRIYYKIKT